MFMHSFVIKSRQVASEANRAFHNKHQDYDSRNCQCEISFGCPLPLQERF